MHHVLYHLCAAGRPERCHYWVRQVLNELYSPEDFPGDEDTGSMAAWYILSALGFYPLCAGKPEYILGSPLFKKVTLHFAAGKKLVIEAHAKDGSAEHVSRVALNGAVHRSARLSHEEIMRGGTLSFTMQETPQPA